MIRIRPRHPYAARKLARLAEDRFHERAYQKRMDAVQAELRYYATLRG